jgi:hypothetical protein
MVNDEWQCGQFMAALSISQNVAREPILWWRFRQAAPRSDRTLGGAVPGFRRSGRGEFRAIEPAGDEAPTPRLREILAKLAAAEMVFANKMRADADDLMWDYD